jgi:uncharacterized protein (TIGR00251 family)
VEFLEARKNGTLLRLKIQPGCRNSEFAGREGDELKARIAAPAREGEANRECIRFLAKTLGVAKSNIEIVRGAKSRHKVLLLKQVPHSLIHDLHDKFAEKDLGRGKNRD